MSTEDLHTNRKRGKLSRQPTITETICNEHVLKLEELCAKLHTDCFDGLTSKTAKQMLKMHGFNSYSKPKKIGEKRSSGTLKNKLFGNKHQAQPSQNVDNSWSKRDWNRVFNSRSNDQYLVVRDGNKMLIKRCELVPGDLVLLQNRQIVPADMRVMTYEGELVVDNRIITGNTSELKSNSPTSNDFLLSQNMIFACTELLSGTCEALVLKTGDETVFGELTQFAQKVKLSKRTESMSLSSTSSGSSNSIGPNLSRDSSIDEERSMAPPSPVLLKH